MLALPPVQRKSRILWGKYRWPRSVMGNCVFVWGPQMGKYAWLPKSGQQLLGTYSSDSNGKNVYNHRTRLVENFRQNTMPITGAQEPAATNLMKASNDLTNAAYWVDLSSGTTTATANDATAPDGTTTATKLQGNHANTYWGNYGSSVTGKQSTTVTVSFWAKATGTVNGTIYAIINVSGGGNYTQAITLTQNWQRFSFTQALGAGDSGSVRGAINHGNGNVIHAWGFQLESGAFPTSYIPTTSAAVARAADAFRFTNDLFDAVKGQGTLLAVMRAQHDVADLADDVGYIALTDSGDYATDGIRAAQLMSGDGELYVESYQGGTPSQSDVNQAPTPAEYNALAFSWNANGGDCFRALNGTSASLSLAWLPSSLDGLEIGSDASANARNGFDYALVAIFDRPLTEPEMVALTANPDRYAYTPY